MATMTGADLRVTRAALRMSQMALAKASGISRYRLSLCENGFGKLSEDEWKKLDQVFRRETTDDREALNLFRTRETRIGGVKR